MSYTIDPLAIRPPVRPHKSKEQHGRRPPVGAHFDADELSRRLYLVLADQTAADERRRRARAEATRKEQAAAAAATAAAAAGGNTSQRQSISSSSKEEPRPQSTSGNPTPTLKKSKSILERATRRKESKLTLRLTTATHNHQTEAGDPYSHPYVPREAAAQFARTTTALNMREGGSGGGLAHRLSRNALRFHLDGDRVDPNAPAWEQTRALKKAQSRREQVHERNQFQRTRILEEAAEAEELHHHQLQHRHTFTLGLGSHHNGGGHNANNTRHHQQQQGRPRSMGDLLERIERSPREEANRHSLLFRDSPIAEESSSDSFLPIDPTEANEHRVDWTQSDELSTTTANQHQYNNNNNSDNNTNSSNSKSPKNSMPLLKRPVSIWTLKGRLGSSSNGGISSSNTKDGRAAPPPLSAIIEAKPSSSSPELPKSPKINL